jgi:hypothetical protein
MKIAYFTGTYAPEVNGVTNTLTRLGSYLEGKQIQYVVFAPAYGEDTKTFSVISENSRVYRFKGITTAAFPGEGPCYAAVCHGNN